MLDGTPIVDITVHIFSCSRWHHTVHVHQVTILGSFTFAIDPETGKITQANPAASNFYGYTVDELENMELSDLLDMNEEEVIEENRDAVSKDRCNIIQYHKLKNDERKKVEIFKGNINLTNKILDYYIIHEIENVIESNEELEDVKFKSLADNIDEIVIIWGKNKEIKDVNLKFSEFFKMSKDIVKGTNVCRYIGFEDNEKLEIDTFLDKKIIEFETEVNDYDEIKHTVNWKNIVVEDDQGFISVGNIIGE